MVVVFGSINLDLVTRAPRLPSPGETLTGSGFASYPGGKGANQALAAARAGAVVRMHGAVGRDAAAGSALALLRAGEVDVSGVLAVDAPTGCATWCWSVQRGFCPARARCTTSLWNPGNR